MRFFKHKSLRIFKHKSLRIFTEKSNGYWLGALSTYERMGVDTHSDYKEMVKNLKASEISDFLKNVILKSGNHFEIIMKAVKNEK